MSDELPVLAAALGASDQPDALLLLGRLLDSLPIPVLLADCAADLKVRYGNPAWRRWVPADTPPDGRPLAELFADPEENPLLGLLRTVCETGRAAHHRDFEYLGLRGAPDVTRWDWEAYPVSDAAGFPRFLIVVAMDVTDRSPSDPRSRQRQADDREKADGILRIFGVAPRAVPSEPEETLSGREEHVAELVGRGLSNAEIATELYLSRSTVASHVATILQKLGFRSRVQIAAWVVEKRLRASRPPAP